MPLSKFVCRLALPARQRAALRIEYPEYPRVPYADRTARLDARATAYVALPVAPHDPAWAHAQTARVTGRGAGRALHDLCLGALATSRRTAAPTATCSTETARATTRSGQASPAPPARFAVLQQSVPYGASAHGGYGAAARARCTNSGRCHCDTYRAAIAALLVAYPFLWQHHCGSCAARLRLSAVLRQQHFGPRAVRGKSDAHVSGAWRTTDAHSTERPRDALFPRAAPAQRECP
jgi:hypothetical protein